MLIVLTAAGAYALWRFVASSLRGLPGCNEDMVFF